MKLFAVEIDLCGRRRVVPPRYASRAEAQAHCDRVAPLYGARIVVIRTERGRRPAHSHTAQVPA